MNFKIPYLKAKVCECLKRAKLTLVSRVPVGNFSRLADAEMARDQLQLALYYARQLPDCPKYRAMRAHIVAALEAMQ